MGPILCIRIRSVLDGYRQKQGRPRTSLYFYTVGLARMLKAPAWWKTALNNSSRSFIGLTRSEAYGCSYSVRYNWLRYYCFVPTKTCCQLREATERKAVCSLLEIKLAKDGSAIIYLRMTSLIAGCHISTFHGQ